MDLIFTMKWAFLSFVLLTPALYIAALVLWHGVLRPAARFVFETDIPDITIPVKRLLLGGPKHARYNHEKNGWESYHHENEYWYADRKAGSGYVGVPSAFAMVCGLALAILVDLYYVDGETPDWLFNTLFLVTVFVGSLYVLRYAARLVKWVSKIASVAHSHSTNGDIHQQDAPAPSFTGDK